MFNDFNRSLPSLFIDNEDLQNLVRHRYSTTILEYTGKRTTPDHLKLTDFVDGWNSHSYTNKESVTWDKIRNEIIDMMSNTGDEIEIQKAFSKIRMNYVIAIKASIVRKSDYHFKILLDDELGDVNDISAIHFLLNGLIWSNLREAIKDQGGIYFESKYDSKKTQWVIQVRVPLIDIDRQRFLNDAQEKALFRIFESEMVATRRIVCDYIYDVLSKDDVDDAGIFSKSHHALLDFSNVIIRRGYLDDITEEFCEKFDLPRSWYERFEITSPTLICFNAGNDQVANLFSKEFMDIKSLRISPFVYSSKKSTGATLNILETKNLIDFSGNANFNAGHVLTEKGLKYVLNYLDTSEETRQSFLCSLIAAVTPPDPELDEARRTTMYIGWDAKQPGQSPVYSGSFRRAESIKWILDDKTMCCEVQDGISPNKQKLNISHARWGKPYTGILYGYRYYLTSLDIQTPFLPMKPNYGNHAETFKNAVRGGLATWFYSPELQQDESTDSPWFKVNDVGWIRKPYESATGIHLVLSSEDEKIQYRLFKFDLTDHVLSSNECKFFFVPDPTSTSMDMFDELGRVNHFENYVKDGEIQGQWTRNDFVNLFGEIPSDPMAAQFKSLYYMSCAPSESSINFVGFHIDRGGIQRIHSIDKYRFEKTNGEISTSLVNYASMMKDHGNLHARAVLLKSLISIRDTQRNQYQNGNSVTCPIFINDPAVNAESPFNTGEKTYDQKNQMGNIVYIFDIDNLIYILEKNLNGKTIEDILGKEIELDDPIIIELCELVNQVRESSLVNMFDSKGVLEVAEMYSGNEDVLDILRDMVKKRTYVNFMSGAFSEYLKNEVEY